MKLERRLKALACIGTAVALTAASFSAQATHSWGGYHWARQQNPFTLKLGNNLSSAWQPYLSTSISDWSRASEFDLSAVAGGTRPKNCRPTAGRVEVCNASYGNTGWLGVASISITGGTHITQGTAKMNDTYFNTANYNSPAWRNLVMCQEIGHTFGLGHVDENFNNANLNTCMDYTNSPDSNQHPNNHDYQQLTTIYSHLDSTTTVNALLPNSTPAAMNDIDFAGPGQWGRVVKEARDGRWQIYELDFGGGHKVVTHVTWASGHERGRGVER